MGNFLTKTVALVAVGGLAFAVPVGAEYAQGAQGHGPGGSLAGVGPANTVTRAVTLHAVPSGSALRNVAYVYSTSTTGGTGLQHFHLSKPPAGVYAVSFSATFTPEGTPSAPETFGCWIVQRHYLLLQATASSTSSSGFFVGVSGSKTTQITSSTFFTVGCGVFDGTSWTWGAEPLQVSMTKLDGIQNRDLRPTQQRAALGAAGPAPR